MDVLLINSPIYDRKVAVQEDYLPPIGLGYIATELKKHNISVEILDAVEENYTVSDILEIIEQKKPQFVGINIFSVNFHIVKEIIERCKTKVDFLVGGKCANFTANEIISFASSNRIIVTIGEGEYITRAIVQGKVRAKSHTVTHNRAIYYVDKESIYFPKDISILNLDRDFFRGREVINPYGMIEEAIITSRECLYNCAFCGGARSVNPNVSVRTRSLESIKSELTGIATKNPKTQCIRILDDLFLKNRKSVENAVELFKSYNFSWRAMAHIRSFSNVDTVLLQDLKQSGCVELEIGIESGCDEIRTKIHKIGTVEEVYSTIKRLLSAGINVKGYFIYGFPDESYEQCDATYQLASKLSEYAKTVTGMFRISAFQFRPYHGTELYNELQNSKHLVYRHNQRLDELNGRKQFNFTAGNFSLCYDDEIENFIIKTNNLGSIL